MTTTTRTTTPTLTVRNIEQAAAWLELDGQISDGHWENASPNAHWEVWCDAEVHVRSGRYAEPLGRNFDARKDNYNFTDRELLDVVGKRMLGIVRIARALGIEAARRLEHAPDCETGRIDWSYDFNQKHATEVAELLGLNSIEVKNRVDDALADESYTMAHLLVDLRDLKQIVRTRVEEVR